MFSRQAASPVRRSQRFWEEKTLADFSVAEWEAVCDGCAKCCLHKLEDETTGSVCYTSVACRLLDLESCRCRHYEDRHRWVADCLNLRCADALDSDWLPQTCAYRRLAHREPLAPWHPLVSGRQESVHEAGVSIRAWAHEEREMESDADLSDYILEVDL